MGLEGNHDDVNDGQEVRQAEVAEPKNEVDDQQIRDSLDSLNTLEPQTTEGTSEGGGITEGMTESESEVTEETPIEHAEKLEGIPKKKQKRRISGRLWIRTIHWNPWRKVKIQKLRRIQKYREWKM